ncbi:MAG: aconitate hydratase, partial [Candidatus Bathyarchaeales archaeon]
MGQSLAEKIIAAHLVEGKMQPGEQIGLKIDHTLTQDSTGTLAYLEFEAMGAPHVKTELSLSFVDHNMLQNDFRNADDHRYLQDVAAKYGVVFSRPGNGICHQLYLERFARPGYTLLGSDSHTPTAGGVGMIAIGAGGLDVAAAMAGEPFYLDMPSILGVRLTGVLSPFVSAKDVILAVLKKLTVKGGLNKILEYYGSGVKTLSVPERGTIANMGTETGATTSIFPSDDVTRAFLKSQKREAHWVELKADDDAKYSEVLDLNLSEIEPLIALPHSPDNVKAVSELEGTPVDQVCIGSCTNSSLRDLKMVAGVSLRTFNRNFKGRSGTQSAKVYLVSPETAVASAIYGEITDPRKLGKYPKVTLPEEVMIDDNMFIFPQKRFKGEIRRGPNIKPLPEFAPLPNRLTGEVLLKLGDNVSTDDILPGGSEIMALRSNIPEISKYVFCNIDQQFADRALKKGGGFIVGGENYGQGSSREHAALAPKYLGVKAVIAKSFARIHLANLVNFGIVPLTFADKQDYAHVAQGDVLELDATELKSRLRIRNVTKDEEFQVELDLSDLEKSVLKAGGKLAAIKAKQIK